jgi:hypothetical protein
MHPSADKKNSANFEYPVKTWSRTRKESMDEKDEAREMTVDLRGSAPLTDVTVYLQGVEVNVSPDAFHIYAGHYYKCKQDFKCPDDAFSPVPYFLLCRAIELQIKAKLLKQRKQKQVKHEFGHGLLDAYKALDAQERILGQSELAVLTEADEIYSRKGFEYFVPTDALTHFSRYPDLEILDAIAKKLIDSGSTTEE